MKRFFLFIACFISILGSVAASAASVTKVTISIKEPVVGEKSSFKASVPETASTEITDVAWAGEFEDGRFYQGRDYTITIKLKIKSSSANIFATSSKVHVTINGHKAKITSSGEKTITVKYTWETLGGENPNDPKYKLRKRLAEIAARYSATNTSDDKELLKYLKNELPGADIWSTGTSYKFTRKLPSETVDGKVTVPIGITYEGVTLDAHNFTVVLPALNKSPEAAKLNADKELMKAALKNLPVTAGTSGDDVLAAMNAAAVNGTQATWSANYAYTPSTTSTSGRIQGDILISLGDQKDVISARKSLPMSGDSPEAAISADFLALTSALHKHNPTNDTTQEDLIKVAQAAVTNGSNLKFTGFTKTESTFNDEGNIVITFEMENGSYTRSPRVSMKLDKIMYELPEGIDINRDEWEVLRLTNIERYKEGIQLLVMVPPLLKAADIRVEEIKIDYRLDHKRPDGSDFFTAIDPSFRKYRKMGENAYKTPATPEQAVKGWMNSPGHRANMLTPEFTYIGIGVTGPHDYKYWIQLFSDGSGLIDAKLSTSSSHFNSVFEMEQAYVICTLGEGHEGYVPLEADYMVKNGNQYTLHLKGRSITVTVGN